MHQFHRKKKQLSLSISQLQINNADGLFPQLQSESYHFQLVPVFLLLISPCKPAQGTTYRFSIHKGHHKFDENRHPIQANFTESQALPSMPVSVCKLNFYVPNYIKIRRQEFVLRMAQRQCNQEFQIGEYLIDVSSYIQEFKTTGANRFCLRTFFSEDYELDFEIFLASTRGELQAIVKQAEKARNSEIFKQNRKKYYKKTENRSRSSSQAKSIRSAKPENNRVIDPKLIKPSEVKVEKSSLFRMFSDGEQSQKDELTKSGEKVPLIHTKFKQLAKADTPAQIVMSQSEKLSLICSGQGSEGELDELDKRKLFLTWLYIVLMCCVIYVLMHPVKHV